ncbi:MAG: C40 family peptidase [Micavibrio sp.]|nr:C40 family peptidase [Micavibrio sp.]
MKNPPPPVCAASWKHSWCLGEAFIVEGEENGWSRGACGHDGYKGWVETAKLKPAGKPTHIITAARSHVYAEATIKSPLQRTLAFGSRVTVIEEGEQYARLAEGDWIYKRHLMLAEDTLPDYLATAHTFLETPYYWGGRSGFGIDCSGLVQVSLALAGIQAPRDTEEQITLGVETDRPRATDLAFFPGHVGIMVDADNILHANGFHMKAVIEPLWMVDERSKGVTAIRKLS